MNNISLYYDNGRALCSISIQQGGDPERIVDQKRVNENPVNKE